MPEKGYKAKCAVVALAMVLIWAGLMVRLTALHLGPNEELKAKIHKLHSLEMSLKTKRGRVFDRKGNLLAQDLPVKDIRLDPKVIQSNGTARAVAAQLSRLLGVPREEVLERALRPNRRDERVAKNVTEDVAARVERLRMKGVFTRSAEMRYYPMEEEACHVLGYANAEGVGSAGVEQSFESLLQGRPGLRRSERDGRRREIYTRRNLELPPQPGADVYLTIDQTIQHFAERGLDYAMTNFNCTAAWTIVEDVRTGEILAMASRPAYNLNAFTLSTPEERWNRAIGVNYEPGSIFKTLTIAAAINEGVIATNDVFDCENGMWFYAGKPLRDFHPYGELDVTGILRKSSNIGAAKVAVMLGEQRFAAYLREFGIGQRIGLELPGEEIGRIAPVNRWYKIDITRIAMGHSVSVTALQILNAFCSIGNDGVRMRPYIVSRVLDSDDHVLWQRGPEAVARPVTERTAGLMRSMLTEVTRPGGTGTRAAIPEYDIAGKTGSAEKLENGHYVKNENMASFMGLIPADRPQIGIIVVLDNPHPLRTGGVSAAPVFRSIAEPLVHYLDIRPSNAAETLEYARLPITDVAWEPAPEGAVELP